MHQFHCAYSIYTTTDKGELVCMDLSNGNRHSEKACGSKNVFTPIGQATNNATEGQSGSYRYELSSCMKEKATLTTNTYIVHTGIQVCVCVHSIQSLRSWWTSQWSQCRGVCGQGKQVRAVFCIARDSSIVNDTYCSSPKPQQARHCSVTDECLYSWKADEWGNVSFTQQYNIAQCGTHYCFKGVLFILIILKCSTGCGSGNQTRNVHCVTLYGQRVSSAFCVPSLKPVETTKCFENSSCGKWMTSKWAEVRPRHIPWAVLGSFCITNYKALC